MHQCRVKATLCLKEVSKHRFDLESVHLAKMWVSMLLSKIMLQSEFNSPMVSKGLLKTFYDLN